MYAYWLLHVPLIVLMARVSFGHRAIRNQCFALLNFSMREALGGNDLVVVNLSTAFPEIVVY